MNNVSIVGRHTRDPELRYSKSGTPIASGNVAVDRTFKNAQGEREADFINIVAFRKTAELIAEHFKKGDMIGVTGRIQTRNYENNEGRTVYVTEVVVENITFLPKKQAQNKKPDPFEPMPKPEGEPVDIQDSDLPF